MRSALLTFVLLAACTPTTEKEDVDGDGLGPNQEMEYGTDPESEDTDVDGLKDGDEIELGADPLNPDSDGDGLNDGAEQEAGSDPTLADTDGDTYLDAWEVTEGTDPADADSRIYTGYWPYNPDKDLVTDPGMDETPGEGDTLPRFAYVDQFGEVVDIYDYGNQGTYFIVDVSGIWCTWCKQMANLLDGKTNKLDDYYPEMSVLPELIHSGKLRWVTVLDSDRGGNICDESDIDSWAETYPLEEIAILTDPGFELQSTFNISGYPYFVLVNSDLQIEVKGNNNDPYKAVLWAAENIPLDDATAEE